MKSETLSEAQMVMLSRALEGQIEKFMRDSGLTDNRAIGYWKEVTLLNLLANTLIYRNVLERDAGGITNDQFLERLSQRIAQMQNLLPETVGYHLRLHHKKAEAARK